MNCLDTRQARRLLFTRVFKPSAMHMKFCCLAIVALAMWLGGFGCALCCSTGVTESCCLEARNIAPVRGETGCCSKAESKRASDSEDAISQLPRTIGCSLLPDQSRSTASPDNVAPINSSFALTVHIRIAPFLDPPSPLNRGGTHARCCVLLI